LFWTIKMSTVANYMLDFNNKVHDDLLKLTKENSDLIAIFLCL